MSYYARIALVSLALALATAGLLILGPREAPVTLVAQAPNGEEVPVGATISVTFSRPVDRLSAEQSFRVDPPVAGSFFWSERTLTFRPARALAPETTYRAAFGAGLRDEEGRPTSRDLAWEFRTRGARLLAVTATADGGSALWLVDPGGGARTLLDAPEGISDIAVAPDGTRAVYVAPRGLQRSALVLISLADGSTRPLVDDETASAAAPAWAPAGDFIAFERRALADGQLGVPRIWLAQPDGTLLGPLARGDGGDISYGPAWSPDGNSVAFLDGISQAIKVYSFFTDAVEELPARSGERPSWLPDGSGLVYSAAEAGGDGGPLSLRLRLVTTGAAPVARDLTDGAAAELSPAVSPNGEAAAYTRRGPDGPQARIWLTPTAPGQPRPLSADGPHQDMQPLWSPDGASVAFVRSSAAGPLQSEAVVIDVASGAETVLLADVVQLVWAP